MILSLKLALLMGSPFVPAVLPQDAGQAVQTATKTEDPTQQALTEEQRKAAKEAAQREKDWKNDVDEGKKISLDVEKELRLSKDENAQARLTAIGAEISEIANKTPVSILWGDRRGFNFEYSFKLVEGDDVNAFSLPGGHIYFYEGLLKFCESDDELAGVVGHEISHAAFRHLATLRKEQSKFDIINIPILIAAALSRSSEAMAAAMASQLATQGFVSGWSVQAETAADFGAIQFLSQSRYNPVGILTFMERLAYRDRFAPKIDWGIYQTHPPTTERVRFMAKVFNEAGIPVRRSAVTTSFSAVSKPVEGAFELWFGQEKIHVFQGAEAKDRAAKAVLSINRFFDSVPQMYQFSASGRELLGNGRVLFSIEPVDVPSGLESAVALERAAKALRTAIFDLNYRLGAGR